MKHPVERSTSSFVILAALLLSTALLSGCSENETRPEPWIPPDEWQQVTSSDASDWDPTWSPDGSKLAYSSPHLGNSGSAPYHTIWIIPALGGEPRQLSEMPASFPSWSPDGKRIAFSSGTGGGDICAVWTADTTGTELVRLTSGTGGDLYPQWSPDGSHIVYTSGGYSGPYSSWIIPATGGDPMEILGEDETTGAGTWSPDSTMIAYTTKRTGNFDIWLVPLSGGPPIQLTDSTANERLPSWSPNGRYIAFSSSQPGSHADIWIIPAAGGNAVQATFESSVSEEYSCWSPDGSHIAFSANGDIWIIEIEL
ncbi:TolB family protein [Candidatus Eisenbacteria bacterium]|uniref:TolB family protein n=1 Tax=Eiseniibacteriota bacterium TaxID=2212470 RepID=A0ABV6YJT7_UNCEI